MTAGAVAVFGVQRERVAEVFQLRCAGLPAQREDGRQPGVLAGQDD